MRNVCAALMTISLGVLWSSGTSTCKAEEMRFAVRHDHRVGACRGDLVFGEARVSFASARVKENRSWDYEEIRQLQLLADGEIQVRTYIGKSIELGRDQVYRFQLVDRKIPELLWSFLQGKIRRPLLSELIPSGFQPAYRIAARHRHATGGCQGILEASDRFLVFRSLDGKDSRVWRYGDIQAISSTSPFDMRINILEGGAHSNQYLFDLKDRIAADAYDYIWWRANAGISIQKPPGR